MVVFMRANRHEKTATNVFRVDLYPHEKLPSQRENFIFHECPCLHENGVRFIGLCHKKINYILLNSCYIMRVHVTSIKNIHQCTISSIAYTNISHTTQHHIHLRASRTSTNGCKATNLLESTCCRPSGPPYVAPCTTRPKSECNPAIQQSKT